MLLSIKEVISSYRRFNVFITLRLSRDASCAIHLSRVFSSLFSTFRRPITNFYAFTRFYCYLIKNTSVEIATTAAPTHAIVLKTVPLSAI